MKTKLTGQQRKVLEVVNNGATIIVREVMSLNWREQGRDSIRVRLLNGTTYKIRRVTLTSLRNRGFLSRELLITPAGKEALNED